MSTIQFPEEYQAYFLDKSGYIENAEIQILPGHFINIDVYRENSSVTTGYTCLHFHPNQRIFLDVIYCYDWFRGNGIATMLSHLTDYLLKPYVGYIIRGIYEPSQLSTDRLQGLVCSKEELDQRARKFYQKSGYTIIPYEDYLKSSSLYPDLTIDDDFQMGEEIANCIVTKKIVPLSRDFFFEEDGILLDKRLELDSEIKKKLLHRKNSI